MLQRIGVTCDCGIRNDFFTALQLCSRGIAIRNPSVCPSVTRPSVSLSVKCVSCDKTKESFAQMIFIPYKKTFFCSFPRQRMVGGGRPLVRDILSQTDPI